METNIFYVYIYLDTRKPGSFEYDDLTLDYEPFYVGKGKGRRYLAHLTQWSLSGPNKFKNRKIMAIQNAGLEPIIFKYAVGLSNESACAIEMQLIAKIGRANTSGGPLTNNTDGGETTIGAKYSDVSKELMSSQRKGKKQTPAQYAANCNRAPHSEEHRRKISEAQKGVRRLTDEQYREIAEKHRGYHHTADAREKMSSQRKGKKQTPAQYAATLERARKRKELSNFVPFADFIHFVKSVPDGYKTARGVIAYIKETSPPGIPRNPYTHYRSEWTSWKNLLDR